MNGMIRPALHASLALLLLVCCGSGCTSVLTSASLRDLVWDGDEHAAEAASSVADDESDDPPASTASDRPSDQQAETTAEADARRREAAIEEAVTRLAQIGDLDPAARATLMETLERTQQEDWPAVIDAFAETLAETRPLPVAPTEQAEPDAGTAEPVAAADEAEPHLVAKADLDASPAGHPSPASEPVPPTAPEPAAAAAEKAETSLPRQPEAVSTAAAEEESEPKPAAEPEPPAPPLAIQNACFATRVQAWGVVDRFATDRFRPGQELIVYFELDGLSAGESPAGHTTCIDAVLRLVADDGQVLHDWSFEPIAETCRARRHDYFVRYVVQFPEGAHDVSCRIECVVTDTLSGQKATTSLPLEVLPAAAP